MRVVNCKETLSQINFIYIALYKEEVTPDREVK